MSRIEQVFIQKGRYRVGVHPDGSPKYHDVTAEFIRDHVAGTKGVIEAGWRPDVYLEHPADRAQGKPRRLSAEDRMRNSAGWLADIWVNENGDGAYALDITDSSVARKLKEGTIRYTSPEFTPMWRDGDGGEHQDIVSHVALVARPRNIRQTHLTEPMSFSLEDKMDDEKRPEDDEKDPNSYDENPVSNGGEPGEVNEGDDSFVSAMADAQESDGDDGSEAGPDMPEDVEATADQSQRVAAICAHLEELGVVLPDDTQNQDIGVILDRILTGLKTAAAIRKEIDADDVGEEDETDPGKPEVVEQQGMLQYSLESVTRAARSKSRRSNPLRAKAIRAECSTLHARIDELLTTGRIAPAGHRALLGQIPSLRFSADADLIPSGTFEDQVSFLEELPAGMHLQIEDMDSRWSVEDHHHGSRMYEDANNGVTKEEAEKLVEAQARAGVFGVSKKN